LQNTATYCRILQRTEKYCRIMKITARYYKYYTILQNLKKKPYKKIGTC
jgi:hypothetical protein